MQAGRQVVEHKRERSVDGGRVDAVIVFQHQISAQRRIADGWIATGVRQSLGEQGGFAEARRCGQHGELAAQCAVQSRDQLRTHDELGAR